MIFFYKNSIKKFTHLIRKFVDAVIDLFQYVIFYIYIFRSKKKIIISDIDNTISNTWPHIKAGNLDYLKLEFIEKNVDLVKKLNEDNSILIFLSAREHVYYFKTKKWLKRRFSKFILFTVSNPKKKIKYIKHKNFNRDGNFFIDDLSHNHENGEVKFYDDLIAYALSAHFKYYGYDRLK